MVLNFEVSTKHVVTLFFYLTFSVCLNQSCQMNSNYSEKKKTYNRLFWFEYINVLITQAN